MFGDKLGRRKMMFTGATVLTLGVVIQVTCFGGSWAGESFFPFASPLTQHDLTLKVIIFDRWTIHYRTYRYWTRNWFPHVSLNRFSFSPFSSSDLSRRLP